MAVRDSYGAPLTTSATAADAYVRGVGRLLRLQPDAAVPVAEALAHDPTFALAHAALALLGHEQCAEVDVAARLRDARLHAARGTDRERSHVRAVASHVAGDSAPLVRHLGEHPTDALLLATAVPTIAFAGVSEVPEDAWRIVERAAPAYGDDWWATGLLAFVRQEQHRYDEAMDLSCRALALEPSAGHAAHARAHAHYETGDHAGGLGWMDSWLEGPGAGNDGRSHFVWHAALHELSLGDLDAVRARYEAQLLPAPALGCRALVDTGSLLHRWALTPDATDVPGLDAVVAVVGRRTLEQPATPFVALHAAVVLLATGDGDGLRRLASRSAHHEHPTHREVVAPLAEALRAMHAGRCSAAADALAALESSLWRLGGSDAQREVVEETRIAALLRAGRYDEARVLLDRRLDRRPAERDRHWRAAARAASEAAAERLSPASAGHPTP
ncbi:pyridine nucleotide-disulfide oxidoreductase [Nocardioides abyssi]|uniref:Tetratricopeptide repeat protein 38 n=1 Tax=Nocardioides abyssi TaxID=3058370 RepID=A0ABT8EVF9_9ACTN|nr:pyridine nucleotide-disulfide oxidoreductase [Nocardioides abyssi]MDN4162160.1 pyridine nucleotide-disulfide oxidoreductase [Nocardioides abyssi]